MIDGLIRATRYIEGPSVWQPWWHLQNEFYKEYAFDLPCFLVTKLQFKLMMRFNQKEGPTCPFQPGARGMGWTLFGIPVYFTDPNCTDEMVIPSMLEELRKWR